MTNYSQDEDDRERDKLKRAERNSRFSSTSSVKLNTPKTHLYTVAFNDEQFLQVAKMAARRNVTFNQMVNMTLLKNLEDDDQSEHSSQLLNEG
jgi:hypothetical protein